ncbi:YesL family protein [Georgenia alba]|uniref:YesL family protein n=1 Tax=Georgenia alba TaxID=2233858 RepID=A0ABW2Q4A7_9MICO
MTSRMYALSEWVLRAMLLNLLWLLGTLAGAVLLGFAPATLAAHHVARQYARGTDGYVLREYVATYRREFWRAQALLLPPVLLLLAATTSALLLRGSALPGADVVAAASAVVAGCLVLVLLYLPSLAVHYDVPTTRALSRAFLLAVANLPSTVLLVLVLAATCYASARLPGLLPVISVGGWILGSTALCLRFYAQNDDAVAASHARRAHVGTAS